MTAPRHLAHMGCRALLAIAFVMVLSTAALAIRNRFIAADPDSVGGIPYSGSLFPGPMVNVPFKATVIQVIDAERKPVSGVLVLITLYGEPLVTDTATDTSGCVLAELPDVGGLSLSLPLNGVFEVPIEAGAPVLVVLP